MPSELRNKRYAAKLGYIIMMLIVPLFIINDAYHIFELHTKTSIKLTGGLVMAVLIAWYFIRNRLGKWISNLAPGGLRIVCHALYKSGLLIVLWVFIHISSDAINNFITCFRWVSLSIICANVIEGYENVLDQQWNEIKQMKRQDEYRSDYKL